MTGTEGHCSRHVLQSGRRLALLLAFTALPLLAPAALSQERVNAYDAINDRWCLSAIHRIQDDVESRKGGDIQDVLIESPQEADAAAGSPVPGRQKRLWFNLNTLWSRRKATDVAAKANDRIMSSPLLVKSYADALQSACPDVGSVVFYMWEFGIGWSVGADGRLMKDRCVLPSQDRKRLIWGEIPCS